MPTNNPMLFNAAVAGLNGSQERWLRSNIQGNYVSESQIVNQIASIIDSSIPSFGNVDLSESARLLQSITSGVFSQRPLISTIDYDSIASSIAALFLQMQSILQAVPDGGEEPDDDNVMSMNFNGGIGTSVLQALTAGAILLFSQITISTPFDDGTTIQLGTSAQLNQFIDLSDPAPGSYADALILVPQNDFLILTVISPSSNGSGTVFYESQ